MMQTYISILRGINVSGQRMIKMEALRQLYSDLGYSNVQSYIQSGNIIFQDKRTKQEDFERNISKKILEKFGFVVPVIVLTLEELKQIVNLNPFRKDPGKDIAFLHLTFLSKEPDNAAYDNIKKGQYIADELKLIHRSLYLYCPNGYSKSKLTNGFFENRLKVTATTRNWKTTTALLQIAENLFKS